LQKASQNVVQRCLVIGERLQPLVRLRQFTSIWRTWTTSIGAR
jgi:hypothetical protein